MKGLILKDFMNLKQQWKIWAIFLIFMVLCLYQVKITLWVP